MMRLVRKVREGRVSAWLAAEGYVYWKELRRDGEYRASLRHAKRHIRGKIEQRSRGQAGDASVTRDRKEAS